MGKIWQQIIFFDRINNSYIGSSIFSSTPNNKLDEDLIIVIISALGIQQKSIADMFYRSLYFNLNDFFMVLFLRRLVFLLGR